MRLARARRNGTVSLNGLQPASRIASAAAIAGVVTATLFLFANLVLEWWPAPVLRVPGPMLAEPLPGRLSLLPFLLGLVLVAASSAAIAAAFASADGPRRRIGLILLGVVGAEIGVALIGVGRLTRDLFPTADVAPRVLGAGAILAAAGLGIMALTGRRAPSLAAVLAAVPSVAALLAVPALSGHASDVAVAATDPAWPARIESVALAAGSLASLVTVVAGLVGVLFVWQSVVAARAIRRQIGRAAGAATDRRPAILAGLIGAKAVWLAVGYLGLLPIALAGTTGEAWARARAEDPLGIVFGVGLVAVAGAWLLCGARPPVSDDGVAPATALMVVGFTLPAILAAFALLALALLNTTTGTVPTGTPTDPGLADCVGVASGGASPFALCLVRAFTGLIEYGPIVTYGAAVALAVILAWRGTQRPLVLALAAIVVWITPTALGVVRGYLIGEPPISVGKVELLTLDALLTGLVAVLAVSWWAGRQRSVGPGALAIVLVSSTLVANAGALVPPGRDGLVIGCVLVFAAILGLLFEGRDLNRAGRRRDELVPRALGLQLLGLALVVIAVAFDSFAADGADLAELFVPPVIVLLVGAELSRGHGVRAGVRADSPALPWRSAARAAAVGALVLAIVVIGAASLRLAPPDEPGAVRYAAYVQHVDSSRADLHGRLNTMASAATVVSYEAFVAGVRAEAAWVDGHVPSDCYATEFERWRREVNALDGLIAALVAGDVTAQFETFREADLALDAGASPCQTVVP